MARVMRRDGIFLFDYLNVTRELERLIQREKRQTPIGEAIIERWFDSSDRSFNKRITIGQRRYLERVRGYDLDEITMMFTSCGMEIRDVFGDFDGSEYRSSSPRLILIGRKSG